MADLILEPVNTDVSDFWRPRLTAQLKTEPVPPGLYRFRLQTHRPTYVTLRLWLEGLPSASMTVFPDRVAANSYAKVFSIHRSAERLELELEPHLDPNVVLSTGIERVGFAKLLARRRSIAGLLTSPRKAMLKARQVWSGKSNLAFTEAAPRHGDPQTNYHRWRAAFEGPEERARIRAEVRSLYGERPPPLLSVHVGRDSNVPDLQRSLAAIDAEAAGVRIVPLVVLPDGAPMPEHLAALVETNEGYVYRRDGSELPVHLIIEHARRCRARAFVYVDDLGDWDAWGLAMVLIELARSQDCMAVYGDSDRIDAEGGRLEPDFKPAWSRRYQLASGYVGNGVAFRADDRIYEACGGSDANANTASSLLHAMIGLRKTPCLVRHVPRVTFHQKAAVADQRSMAQAELEGAIPVNEQLTVSVIVPSKNNAAMLEAAARAVLRESGIVELVVVDNGSTSAQQSALVQRLSQDPRVRLVRDARSFNFSQLVNCGVAQSRGSVVVLLNDDIEAIETGWLDRLAKLAAEPEVGCVGAVLLYPSGRIQHGGILLGVFGVGGHAYRNFSLADIPSGARLGTCHEVGAVTGACLAVRREVFDEVGGFDEELPVTLNDVDFCLRVHARGYSNLMLPHVRLTHHESATRGLDAAPEHAERLARETACFMGKWGLKALSDPFYSPHLTLSREDCSLRDI